MAQPLLDVRGVETYYGNIRALNGVSLDINEGDFCSIIGPSGSGKSTLMHILGCLDSPTSGTLKLDGLEIQNASQRQLAAIRNQKIGFVFQFFNLLPKLNVLQNVELPMVYSGLNGRQRRDHSQQDAQPPAQRRGNDVHLARVGMIDQPPPRRQATHRGRDSRRDHKARGEASGDQREHGAHESPAT